MSFNKFEYPFISNLLCVFFYCVLGRLLALDEKFQRDVATLQEDRVNCVGTWDRQEFRIEREHIQERHALEKRELALIVQQVERPDRCD